MSTQIFPMAYIPATNTRIKLYFIGFPQNWKRVLIDLTYKTNPRFNDLYALPTNLLQDYLNSWLEDVVDIKPLRTTSDDSRWLVATEYPDIDKLCEIMSIWLSATYVTGFRVTDETKEVARNLIRDITPDILANSVHMEELELFNDMGQTVSDYSYRAFVLTIMKKLTGQKLTLFGEQMVLNRTDKDELISDPIYPSHKDKVYPYSYAIKLSLQTTPPERRVLLVLDVSIRRYISYVWAENPFLTKKVFAHVKTASNRYKKIAIRYKSTIGWDEIDQKCYNLYNFAALPDAYNVICNVEQYYAKSGNPQILCPYANGLKYADTHMVGTGVSVVDKFEIYKQIEIILSDLVCEPQKALICKAQHISSKFVKTYEERRFRLANCISSKVLRVEIYGHDKDKELSQAIASVFWDHFGGCDELNDITNIKIEFKSLGGLSDAMGSDNYYDVLQRIDQVKAHISVAAEITGAIVILPSQNGFKFGGDPKTALRAGFADTNRITQFITPDDENEGNTHRIVSSVFDLLRQLGYTEGISKDYISKHPIYDTTTIGVHVFTQLESLGASGKTERAKYLPVYVIYNPATGQIYVDCEAFERRHVPYLEAMIELSKLSRRDDFVKKCNEAYLGTIKQKMLGYRNLYKNESALVLINSNGNTRSDMWPGISDKSISTYDCISDYVPSKIDIGTKGKDYLQTMTDSQIRIMRVRINEGNSEIPDYYTDWEITENGKQKHQSASGIYRYGNVFWGLASRPNDLNYINSFKFSKVDHPFKEFDERNLVEFYPIQLQEGDDVTEWIRFANSLRECMPEYSGSATKLPAPLHLAQKMGEYLLIK